MRTRIITLFLMLGCISYGQLPQKARFDYFEYTGCDSRFNQKNNRKKQYFNPIISGFYPDPSICRKGDDYYLVNSTFSFYPGIPIFHSKDLVNWKQIGHVLDRPNQLNLDGLEISQGIYAPAIEYNPNNETFYVVTTMMGRYGNFFVKSKDPSKGWSDPIPLPKVGGIDPSFFFDDDGKAYLVHNDVTKNGPLWEGHRAIWVHQFDTEKDQTIGQPMMILDGGIDPSTNPVWIEGPHLYKINGKYYLMAAEGGTGVHHSEVILKGDSPMGPFSPAPLNPILTQRYLPENRPNKVTSTGHADIIQTKDGSWWAVFLGCRPYENDLYNTGRETFLLPVKWENDFPIILDSGLSVPVIVEKTALKPYKRNYLSGNFKWRDDFNTSVLGFEWNMIRTPRDTFYQIKSGHLILNAAERSIYERKNPAFVGHRQKHLTFSVETKVEFNPLTENELAGLVCFQNEAFNIVMGITLDQGEKVVTLERMEKDRVLINKITIPKKYDQKPVLMRVQGNGRFYSFFISFDNQEWIKVSDNVDASNLSTNHAAGFVGTYIGLYATSCKNNTYKKGMKKVK